MATSTTSASTVAGSPSPEAGAIVTVWPRAVLSMPVTLAESLKLMPCLVRMRCTVRATSASVPGRMRSRNSTTCTRAPSLRHTEPSSRPMTPAPTTSRRSGTRASDSAPVEDTTDRSSRSMPGRRATSEPVAMTIDLPSTSRVPPAASATLTRPGAEMVPVPWTTSILFLRSRKATPSTLPLTPSSLKASILARSSLGAASIPMAAKPWLASSKASEACSRALEGMQPTLRQVPPWVARFSTTATLSPSWAARMAHT